MDETTRAVAATIEASDQLGRHAGQLARAARRFSREINCPDAATRLAGISNRIGEIAVARLGQLFTADPVNPPEFDALLAQLGDRPREGTSS